MLTAVDVKNTKFTKEMGGYKAEEVDAFMELAASTLNEISQENYTLKKQVDELSQRVEEYTKMEQVLKESIVVAKMTADDIKENSQKEAEIIVKEAELNAKALLDEKQQEIYKLENNYEKLKQEVEIYKTKIKTVIENQLKMMSEETF